MSQVSQIQRSLIVSTLGLLLFGCERLAVQFKGVRLPASSNSINGIVQPIASSSALSLSKVTSLSCTTAEAKLIALDGTGKRILPAKATTQVEADGRYSFNDLSSLGITSSSFLASARYIVEINGCAESYARIVTGLNGQNINYGTSLLSWVAETQHANTLTTIPLEKIDELGSMISSASSTDAAFTRLTSDTSVSTAFNNAFGVAPATLPEAAPRIVEVLIPEAINELASSTVTATIKHWSSTYPMAYEWKLDGAVIGTTPSASWIPGANSQGAHTLILRVGRSDGSGIDSSKPVESKSFAISVANNVLPQAPALTIASEYVNSPSLTLSLDTGALVGGIPANCSSFSSLALVESDDTSPITTAPAAGAFTISCSGAGPQSLSYSLSTGEGVKTLRLWARDASGQISATPRTLQVRYSTLGPSLTISSPAAGTYSNGSINLTGTCTSDAGSISISGDVVSPSSTTCSGGSFTASINLSNGDGTKTVSVAQTNAYGNTTTFSRSFILDTIAPVLAITAPSTSSYVNAAGVSAVAVTGTCSEDVTVQLRATGGATNVTASPVCSSGAFSATLDLSTLPEGSVTVTANASDLASNAAVAVGVSLVKDTTPPTATIAGTPLSPSRTTTLNVTVAGTSVTHYQYKVGAASSVNCAVSGGYSSDVAVAASLASDISGSADGSMKLCVIGKDAAGNYQALASATSHTWTKDTVVTPFGALSVTPVGPSQNNKPTISGTTEASSDVELYAAACTGSALATATANSSGSFALTPGSSIGSEGIYNFYVKAIDTLGNTLCSPSPVTYTLDTTAPTLTFASSAVQNQVTKLNRVTFNGSCEAGRSISVSGTDTATASCTGGSWSYQTSDRTSDTTYNYTFTQTDVAGNSSAVSGSWIRDTIAPALTWSLPSAGVQAKAGITVTGTCETGTPVAFSGTGLLSSYSIACSAGSFSQALFFSDGDGSKSITVGQTDLAGNTTSETRNFVRDNQAPLITQTAYASPYSSNLNTVQFSGSCEANLTVQISRDSTPEGTTSCSSGGAWSYTVQSQTTDGSRTYSFSQVDAAGNSGSISSTWVRDTVAPSLTLAQSGTPTFTSSSSNVTFSGTCETGRTVSVSGAATGSTSCSGGSWSYQTPTQSTASEDVTRSYTFTQQDAAANSTSVTGSWRRITSIPNLTVVAPEIVNNQTTATFTGSCETGLTITPTGPGGAFNSSTGSCPAGTWSYTTSALAEGSHSYSFSQTNAVSLTSTVSAQWLRDITAPQFQAGQFIVESGASETTRRAVSLSLRVQDSLTPVTHLCLQHLTKTTPANSDSCWLPVDGSQFGLTPALSLTVSNYLYALGLEVKSYEIAAFARDKAGNRSTLASAGAGESQRDLYQITLKEAAPPSVSNVYVSNSDSSSFPVARADLQISAGQQAYIKWTAADASGLIAKPIQVEFSTDDANWSMISANGGLINGITGSCSVAPPFTGCMTWTSPTNAYYRVRVSVENGAGLKALGTSQPANASAIELIAGRTDLGVGSSAKSALFVSKSSGNRDFYQRGSFVITDNGTIVSSDPTQGLLYIDPQSGRLEVLVPKKTGCAPSAAKTSVAVACVADIHKMVLGFKNDLWIFDNNLIRRIDVASNPMTIETVIGGGSGTSDAIVSNPLTLKLTPSGDLHVTQYTTFVALPNGDLYFHSEHTGSYHDMKRLRVYRAATGQVQTLNATGIGFRHDAAQDLSKCVVENFGFLWNSSTQTLEKIVGGVQRPWGSATCPSPVTNNWQFSSVWLDPSNFTSLGTGPQIYDGSANGSGHTTFRGRYILGMDLKLYAYPKAFSTFKRYDPSSDTWTNLIGSGTGNSCADGQLAATCPLDADDFFITKTGDVFFMERGRIRMIDSNQKVQTVYGQDFAYGDGGNALNARFGNAFNMDISASGRIAAFDAKTFRVREIQTNGVIQTILGSGVVGTASSSSIAVNTALALTTSASGFAYDENEDILLSFATSSRAVDRWSRSTGLYTRVAGGGTKLYSDADADGSYSGTQLTLGVSQVLGYSNGQLLLTTHSVPTSASIDSFHLILNTLSSFSQTTLRRPASLGLTVAEYCATGTSLSACNGLHSIDDNHARAQRYGTKWLYVRRTHARVRAMEVGGTMENFSDLNAGPHNFVYVNQDGRNAIYYCSAVNNRIYRRDLSQAGQPETALTWPIAKMKCDGRAMHYRDGALIFLYSLDGLTGIAKHHVID